VIQRSFRLFRIIKPINSMSRVAVTHGDYRKQNIDQALSLVADDVVERLRSARSVLIKPNFVSSSNQLAATHVDAARSVIEFVRKYTQVPIIVGEAGYRGTKAAFRNFGYENLVNEYSSIELRDLNDDETVLLGAIPVSKIALESDFKISVANLKTCTVDVTLATKNWAVGTVIVEPKVESSGKKWTRSELFHQNGVQGTHDTISALYAQNKPNLAVIDGFMGMEGQGPSKGDPIEMKVALAGADSIAVDRTASQLMGFDPNQIKYLSEQVEVQLVGQTDLTQLSKTFKRHSNSNI
jgi:uncharacterized protein (DUF362 family)